MRKRQLAAIMPRVECRVRLLEHIERRGTDFFRVARAHNLEGIVASTRTVGITPMASERLG